MNDYRNLLVVVDPAMQHSTAFARGVELAKKTGASLTLLLAGYLPALDRARVFTPDFHRQAVEGWLSVRRRWLETEAAKLQEQGVTAAGIAVWHKPAWEGVARAAMDRAPDLVISDAGNRRADWHLMRACPAPLLLVSAHSSSFPQRILAAVDPLDAHDKPAGLNDAILAAALAIARQCEAPVHVVHAWQATPDAMPFAADVAVANAGLFEAAREEHRQRFIAFGDAHGVPLERMHLIEGQPAKVIAGLAEDINADLVVMGTVQRTGLKRAFMGSTAEDILEDINSDVLVLKPEDFVEALRNELSPVD